MSRERFQYFINALRADLLHMGSQVENALERVITSMETENVTTAEWIIQDDKAIDETQLAIEERAQVLIATQQPVASDLRLMSVVIAIASELERVGDYTSGIAKRIKRRATDPMKVELPPEIYHMARLSCAMLHKSLEAFLEQDAAMARQLVQDEEQVDVLEDRLRIELIDIARNDPQRIDAVIDFIDILHVIERIADRATNIGERVIFLVTSEMEPLNP